MNRRELISLVRSNARDFTNSIFRETDIILYLNEGVDRVRQVIKECRPMTYLNSPEQVPSILPVEYHSLLATFSTARCFGQDERHYQASTFMNEFESKLDELKQAIQAGDIILTDGSGNAVETVYTEDYVDLSYWNISSDDEGYESLSDIE